MEKQTLSEKLKELRNMKGLSQEQLSEMSNISVRTIQRIEKGKSIPTGDTLNKIADALDATIDGLVINDKKEDKGYLSLITLSAISYILHPFLGILLPVILWYLKRNTVLDADETGRKLISFQLTWQLAFFIYLAVRLDSSILQFYHYNISSWAGLTMSLAKDVFKIELNTLYFFNLFMVLLNLIFIQVGFKTRYFVAIPFMGIFRRGGKE